MDLSALFAPMDPYSPSSDLPMNDPRDWNHATLDGNAYYSHRFVVVPGGEWYIRRCESHTGGTRWTVEFREGEAMAGKITREATDGMSLGELIEVAQQAEALGHYDVYADWLTEYYDPAKSALVDLLVRFEIVADDPDPVIEGGEP
jgi:hypothetical protein